MTQHPLVTVARKVSKDCEALSFTDPVTHVFDPTVYARDPHEKYLTRFGNPKKQALLVGMNPGPWGMAQTGVPFGEIAAVRDFLGITGEVHKPEGEHEKRPVQGFECMRSEVSGKRLWGWVERRFGTADAFFERFFIANYCPLIFMEEKGKNRPPDKIRVAERRPLLEVCDAGLRAMAEHLQPEMVIGVGAWAKKRAEAVFGDTMRCESILHPSPANPNANRGWAAKAEAQLEALGIELP